MKVLVVNQSEIRRLLPMPECMEVMADALRALARGEAILPLRPMMWLPETVGVLAMMPSYLGSIDAMGVKVISVMPGNHGTPFDSHQGAVLLFEAKHGQLLAMMDATEITAIRTAAVSGVATQLLARQDAHRLGLLGTGVQARTHLAAMVAARPIDEVRVWSRNASRAEEFAAREATRHGIAVRAVGSARDAVANADIICTTTSSREPVLEGEWIAPGTHINAVGASIPSARELSTSAVQMARLYVDRRESTLNEAGDFLMAKRDGAIGDEHIVGEIGELLMGTVPGRVGAEDITLFKSLGIAVEDLASAHHIYRKALAQGVGVSIELGGERDDD